MNLSSQQKAMKKYDAKFKKVTIRLDPELDNDILLQLYLQPNVTQYLKNLIREDLRKEV